MDPLTAASTFATIVGLIGQFKGERPDQEESDLKDFLEWLIQSNHKDLKELLEKNSQASDGIKTILKEDREIFLQKLEAINNALSSFSSGISGFADVAEAISPTNLLSKQAISILYQFEESLGSKLLELNSFGGMNLLVIDGNGGSIDIAEPRFIEDDLKYMIELGLLRLDYNSKGENLYIYTRSASQLVNAMEKKT